MVTISTKTSNLGILKVSGTPARNPDIPTNKVLFFREISKRSMMASTGTSIKFTADERAANIMLRKNKIPKKYPPGIILKMLGIVMNSSGGPAWGSKPKAKTAGIMTKAASIEEPVLNRTVVKEEKGISSFFSGNFHTPAWPHLPGRP